MKMRTAMLGLVLGLMVAMGAGIGCAGLTQKDKVAVACDSAATALDVLTEAKKAGKITKAELDSAIEIYRPTKRFCEPIAEKLSAEDYAALVSVVAVLATKRAAVHP